VNNFFRRSLTAFWIVIIVFGGFYLHPLTFFIAGLVITAGSIYEYYRMTRIAGSEPQIFAGIFSAIVIYIISALVASGIAGKEYLVLAAVSVPLVIITGLYRKTDTKPFDAIAQTLFGVVYVALPSSLMLFSAFIFGGPPALIGGMFPDFSPAIVAGFILLIWANDTGAYLTGITLGRHRLMERISPKKTWEGLIGGIAASLLASLIVFKLFGTIGKADWMIVSVIVSVAGTYGDLAESMLKRSVGVKDSGNIMPGHGGFLDRFDSLLFSFPLVFIYLLLFG